MRANQRGKKFNLNNYDYREVKFERRNSRKNNRNALNILKGI